MENSIVAPIFLLLEVSPISTYTSPIVTRNTSTRCPCVDCDWLSQDSWPLIGLPGGRCGYNAPSPPGNAGYIVLGETPKQ